MHHKSEDATSYELRMASIVIFTMLFIVAPPVSAGETITLRVRGDKTAHEGSQVEYYLEIENTGTTPVEGIEVLNMLPDMVDLVEAIPAAGGAYDPVSGIWSLPALGTMDDNRSAGLKILALVRTGLLADPSAFVVAENRAEVIAPVFPDTIKAEVSTNIVCAFCIDWEILSVELGSDYRVEVPDPLESRFFLYVKVTNNGPVTSEATLSTIYFNLSGGGFDSAALTPSFPVPVLLDVGETRTITFSTDWENGPNSDYTISWEFAVSDLSLADPVTPNTAAGSWSGKVEGGGGGCSINENAVPDPLWLLYLLPASIYPAWKQARRMFWRGKDPERRLQVL